MHEPVLLSKASEIGSTFTMHKNNDKYYTRQVFIYVRLKLKLNIGNGYLDGSAANDLRRGCYVVPL